MGNNIIKVSILEEDFTTVYYCTVVVVLLISF